jgi:Predicted Zn-dependent protease (DUF2268)
MSVRHTILAALLLLVPAVRPLRAEESPAPPAPSFVLVNLIPAFLAYHAEGAGADAADRARLWDALVESKDPTFFNDAIYRRKEGEERERYKRDCIRRFFAEVAPKIEDLRRRNESIEDVVKKLVADFRKLLPGSEGKTEIYITVSFSFRGKAVTVGDRTVLAIGLEHFEEPGDLDLSITLAHELFHFEHFRTFSAGGGLYRLLWTEGLAVYASALVVPGHRRSAYLGFPVEKMNRCQALLPLLAADLRKHLGENDHRLKRIYFGAEDNDTKVPPEAGYFVGLLIAERMGEKATLTELMGLTAKEVFGVLGRELEALAQAD